MKKQKITIADIAKSAQVSKTTVSRYLNKKYEYMSEETRERIQSIIEMTDYQPNSVARSLKSHKSFLIGLIIADIESPFSSAAIKQIGDCLVNSGYNLITANCSNSYEKEEHYINSLVNQQIDGLIVNTTNSNNPVLINLANEGMPIVLLDRFVNNYNFDIAYFENRRPVNNAVDYLIDQGFGSIHFFVQPYEGVSPRALRREAFLDKMTSMGVESTAEYVHIIHKFDIDIMKQTIDKIIEDNHKGKLGPPAIIASNGVTLLHIAKAIHQLGLKMPDEIGICGYDEWGWETSLGWADLIDVGLTTFNASTYLLGDSIAELLLRRIDDPEVSPVAREIESPMVIRKSTSLKQSK